MSNWLDEITIASGNRVPVPFEEAWTRRSECNKFVFISHRIDLAESLFRRYKTLFPPSTLKKMKRCYLLLEDDSELMFFSQQQVEHGSALRGRGKVVWCV